MNPYLRPETPGRASSDVLSTVADITSLIHSSDDPLPSAPDGLYNNEAAPSTDGKSQSHGIIADIIHSIKAQIKRGNPLPLNPATISAIIDAVVHANSVGIDDRKMLIETAILVLSRLPPNSALEKKLQVALTTLLYNDLPHPPATFVGDELGSRTADGSNNNPTNPNLGRAGQPYARTVSAKHPVPVKSLPDPGLVFDTLLRRTEFTPHPGGFSAFFFHFADIIIHDLFRTSERQPTINDTTSYLDLSPLYGCNQAEQDTVRRRDGRGRLYEDVFASSRIMSMPPGVGCLLVLFCRNHNYIAHRLLQLNERGSFQDPPPTDSAKLQAQDDEIFNKARLINSGLYKNIILNDYLTTIVGTLREGNKLSPEFMNMPIRGDDHQLLGRGRGNAVSIEFNLLYHWHSNISQPDTKWTENLFAKMFPGKGWDEITVEDLQVAAIQVARETGNDPRKWTIGEIPRDSATNRFSDAALASCLQSSTDTIAGAFKARGIPAAMRVIEIMSIEQGRSWGACSLNEFRSYFGLKPYSTFKEWNPDPDVSDTAARLYQHPDNLELYVGLQAEETKPTQLGIELSPGFTIARAILSDAISLVRGDRFHTIDNTPYNLSAWGYQDCTYTKGGITALTKLLLRTLPLSYTFNSVYAHFSLLVPSAIRASLEKDGTANLYDFQKPVTQSAVAVVATYKSLQSVLSDKHKFHLVFGDRLRYLSNGNSISALAVSGSQKDDTSRPTRAFFPLDAVKQHVDYFKQTAEHLIKEKSFALTHMPTRSIDIVHDVINYIPVHWASTKLAGFPLKTIATPNGIYTEQEMFDMLSAISQYIFDAGVEVELTFDLRNHAAKASRVLLKIIKNQLSSLKSPAHAVNRILDDLTHVITGQKDDSNAFLKTVLSTKGNLEELVSEVFAIVVMSTASWAKAASQVVNFYLDDDRKVERTAIIDICQEHNATGDDLLAGYVREALRLDVPVAGVLRQAVDATSLADAQGTVAMGKGGLIFASLAQANLDPNTFGPDPKKVLPTRQKGLYLPLGDGLNITMGEDFAIQAITEVIRVIFSLKNLRRAPGNSGTLNRFVDNIHGSSHHVYVDYNGQLTPYPMSMILQYDV